MKFVFVHGWGYSPSFWQPLQDVLARSFPSEKFVNIDLGFLSDEFMPQENGIYITHSLGTMWALKNRVKHMDALVSICGFTNFTDFVYKRILDAMQKRLDRNAEKQMQSFWSQCGFSPTYDQLNIEALSEGLNWLKGWDVSEQLCEFNNPILSLCVKDDLVAGFDSVQEQWAGHMSQVFEQGGHALPVSKPDVCAQAILDFVEREKLCASR